MKRIVVFYSLEGNTKRAADEIAKGLGAEVLEAVPEKDVKAEGAGKFAVGGMQAMTEKCPKLKNKPFDASAYDEIIIGTPVWAGKCAPAIRSFIKENALDEKVIAVFTCSSSLNNKGCIENMNKMLHHIKYDISLADSKAAAVTENDNKIKEFIAGIQDNK